MTKADIGLMGLGVMGQNLVLNMEDKGFTVAVYNRTVSKVDFFIEENKEKNIYGTHSLKEFVQSLKEPRQIFLMVEAGSAVDKTIESLLPLLSQGDIIIDGGNSLFTDTNRRFYELKEKGFRFIGAGISGGEEGARHGPSIMPGGDLTAWEHVKTWMQKISAQVDNTPCCQWIGDGGAGHYVKMVHNGIEYGDMQLICEAYHLLKSLGLSAKEMHETFSQWNKGPLNSYLIEITADIFLKMDTDGTPLVDHILDVAGQKGTGRWTVANALELGVPLTLIGEAVFSRTLSAIKDERIMASKELFTPSKKISMDKKKFIDALEQALYAAKIVSYTQGFMLMRDAAKHYQFQLNLSKVSLLWRGGCIIRSQFLNHIAEGYAENPDLVNLLFSSYFKQAITEAEPAWRDVIKEAIHAAIPVPALSSALAFFDGYRTERLPANLLQAQRDYFGAHTFERLDAPRGTFFHAHWMDK
jgi:6-phosphogluconate dehydrogenase